jgi:DNA mismatch repair ATPase MutS
MLTYIAVSSDINKTLKQFAEQLDVVEKASFSATTLKELQQSLHTGPVTASKLIAGLRSRFGYLDYFFNIFVSPLLNGLFLFHVHVLYALDKWKKENRRNVQKWLDAVGEMEAMSCFANFSFNNPGFVYPDLSAEEDMHALDLGHPLISPAKRINNNISFSAQKFIVLTGSNMSGKSTFLRTLGINLILARAGSSVCASQYRFYPYDVYVSMRITDSLQDSESLFYAELKRLHTIIAHISAGNKTFIILDEILRGTNSNDKHNGTVGLIRKLISRNACGIIATHDLSVALLAKEFPALISDKCFESEIINDELIFDYKIKEGVCTKLSASFLMKKMGIIE